MMVMMMVMVMVVVMMVVMMMTMGHDDVIVMLTRSEAGSIALVCKVLRRQLSLSFDPPLR